MALAETLEQTSKSEVPNPCISSNFRSARSRFRWNCSGGTASKSRNGWKRQISNPRSAVIFRTSRADPSKKRRSFSKISTASKRAAAMASIFSLRFPLKQTVAMERRIGWQRKVRILAESYEGTPRYKRVTPSISLGWEKTAAQEAFFTEQLHNL